MSERPIGPHFMTTSKSFNRDTGQNLCEVDECRMTFKATSMRSRDGAMRKQQKSAEKPPHTGFSNLIFEIQKQAMWNRVSPRGARFHCDYWMSRY
jgi:hypothetical protein